MPTPKTTPPRIQIQEVAPQIDCGRYAVKRTVGERVEVTARIFRDGHETLGASVRHRSPGATRWAEALLEPVGNDVWSGSFELDEPGLWCFRVEAWIDRVASFQEELRRKVAAGQEDLTGELSEGAVLLERDRADRRGGTRRSRRRPFRTDVVGDVRGRRRPGARPLRILVRALPALVGRLRRRAGAAAALRRARLRRPLPAADPPDRAHEPERPQQRRAGAAGGRRQPVGDRLRRGGPRRDRPLTRHGEGVPGTRRRGIPAGDRDRARLRDPVLARPPLAAGASRVVLPSAGRDVEVRREPAEALPGHLQRRLRE